MLHPVVLKQDALLLRQQGHSYLEISKKLRVSKSTAYYWTTHHVLDEEAKERIALKRMISRIKSGNTWKAKKAKVKKILDQKILEELRGFEFTPLFAKILCAFLFWAEGGKNLQSISFTNSDPKMIQMFLTLLRKSFSINEKKLRVLMHLHEYHNEEEVKKFWSEITQVPLNQFNKSYLKPHTGKNTREGYKGCINIRYFNAKIAQELFSVYTTFSSLI